MSVELSDPVCFAASSRPFASSVSSNSATLEGRAFSTCALKAPPPRKCLAHVTWLSRAVNAVFEDGALLQRSRTDAIGRTALICGVWVLLETSAIPPAGIGARGGKAATGFLVGVA